MAKRKKRKKKRKWSPSRNAVTRSVATIQRAVDRIREKGAKRVKVREKSYRRTVDRYIKEVYQPQGPKADDQNIVPKREREQIIERTSIGAVARRKAEQTDGVFRAGSKRGKHKGQYQVMVGSRRLKKGQWVSAASAARSIRARTYWNKVRMLREALDDEVSIRDVRRMLKIANEYGVADSEVLTTDRSPDLGVPKKGRGPKTKAGAMRRHERQVRAGEHARTAEEMIARYRT